MERAQGALVLLALVALLVPPAMGQSQPRRKPGDCICLDVYAPVCGANGVTYSNSCQAACAGVAVAREGSCDGSSGLASARKLLQLTVDQPTQTITTTAATTTKPTIIPEGCICPAIYMPVCGSDGKTYSNSCEATCAKVTYTSGECPPAGGGCFCILVYDPVCGVDGVTYGNACQAGCANVAVLAKGECPPPITCQPSDPGVKCFADPCSLPGPCKGREGLLCQSNYCGQPTTYLGVKIYDPCAAIYVDVASQTIVECTGTAPPPVVCQDSDPGARCLADPCTNPSPCQGKPGLTCVPNYCTKPVTYLGTTLSVACTPVYVDTATNTVATQCSSPASPPKDPCASISKAYSPVCGADGRTYHNRAAATCQKVAVLYPGACALCPPTTPACPTTTSPVCCSDGNTYCNACTAKTLKKTITYRGCCGPPKCLPQGAVCLLANPKCCSGASCNGGPVLREGQIFGTCIVGIGPIG